MSIFGDKARATLTREQAEREADRGSRLPQHPVLRAGTRNFALISREDRLEWLRAMVNGEVYEQRVHVSKEGEVTEYSVPASLQLRKQCVELMCEIEGDLRERTNVTVNNTAVQYILRDNGRAALPAPRVIEASNGVGDATGQPETV